MNSLRSMVQRTLATVALVLGCNAAQADVVRLRFDFGGAVGPAVEAPFLPLLQPGDAYRAWFEIDYDRAFEGGPDAYSGWAWTTMIGEQRVGNGPLTMLAFDGGSFSVTSMQFLLAGNGESYVDGAGTTQVLFGPSLGLMSPGLTGTVADLLALDVGDVFGLGIWGFSYRGGFGYGRQVAGVVPEHLSISLQTVPEPGALGLVLAALALLAGVHRRGARPVRSVCQTAAHATGRHDARHETHPA